MNAWVGDGHNRCWQLYYQTLIDIQSEITKEEGGADAY